MTGWLCVTCVTGYRLANTAEAVKTQNICVCWERFDYITLHNLELTKSSIELDLKVFAASHVQSQCWRKFPDNPSNFHSSFRDLSAATMPTNWSPTCRGPVSLQSKIPTYDCVARNSPWKFWNLYHCCRKEKGSFIWKWGTPGNDRHSLWTV